MLQRLFLIKRDGHSCSVVWCVAVIKPPLNVKQSLDHKSLSVKKHTKMFRERKRRHFSSICLFKHTILGTHFQAQTDGLMNVNTRVCTRTRTNRHKLLFFLFYFVTALVCPMLSLHAALKLEVLTPTCPGTGVKMLMLMAGIDTRQCSDPSSWYVRSKLLRVKGRRRGERCVLPNHRRWWGRKKGLLCCPPRGK